MKLSLKNLMRTHTGEKPYICDVCSTAFTMKSPLIMHMRTHTGEKPFNCDVYRAAFTQSSDLKNHHEDTYIRDISIALQL